MRRVWFFLAPMFLWMTLSLPAGEGKKDDIAAIEKQLVDLVNAERKKESLMPLRFSPELAKVARAHAENMAKQKKEEHKLDGKDYPDRLDAAGYMYLGAGENLGAIMKGLTLPDLMKAWMVSKAHRINILEAKFEETGTGAARDAAGKLYLAQVFALPGKK